MSFRLRISGDLAGLMKDCSNLLGFLVLATAVLQDRVDGVVVVEVVSPEGSASHRGTHGTDRRVRSGSAEPSWAPTTGPTGNHANAHYPTALFDKQRRADRRTPIRHTLSPRRSATESTLIEMPDQAIGDAAEEGLALQRALPGYGDTPRRFAGLLQRRESAGDWASAGGEATLRSRWVAPGNACWSHRVDRVQEAKGQDQIAQAVFGSPPGGYASLTVGLAPSGSCKDDDSHRQNQRSDPETDPILEVE